MDIVILKKLISPIGTEKYLVAIRTAADLNTEQTEEKIQKVLKENYEVPTTFELNYYGNLDKYVHYKKVVAKFKKKAHGGIPIYRNYCVSEEEQRKRIALCYCNVAEDASTSFNTVMTALVSKFGAIVTVNINNNDNGSSETV